MILKTKGVSVDIQTGASTVAGAVLVSIVNINTAAV